MPKTTIVTGAAGGVGRAVVAELVARGENVVAEDRDPAVRELAGDAVATVVGDIGEPGTAAESVRTALTRFGSVDALVNNAGRFSMAPIDSIDVDAWDSLFRINVRGAFLHLQAALPSLRASRGAVVNVVSISGLVGFPGQLAYSATKGALVQMTRTAAIELAPDAVRVNAVAPGAIATGFMDESLAGAPDRDAVMADIAASHPLGRILAPAEIAGAIAFLLSDTARGMTGVILPVDGGFTAR